MEAELQKPTFSKVGDLWRLGSHRLFCSDSTKAESYDLLMAGKKANLVVTDPPYNVNYQGSAGKIKNDNMAGDAFYQFLLDAFTAMEAMMADDASIYVFHADTEGLNFRKAFSDAGFYLSGTCIWKKQSLVLGRSPYQWQHPKLATMLFIAHAGATAANAGKINFTQNPVAINYPQWIAFAKYSYSQLKWVMLEKPALRDAYVRGKINAELDTVLAEAYETFDRFSEDCIVVFN